MDVEKRVKPEIESAPNIPDVKIIRPKLFPDERGFFSETYNDEEWSAMLGFDEKFHQDNHSFSKYGVLRGLHSQPGMGKLVSVVSGEIYDVAVDARPDSTTFGQYYGIRLNDRVKTCFWVPPGFLHGFVVLSKEGAHVTYKCSAVYDPKTEYGISPFDPEIDIQWPIENKDELIVSDRDKVHPNLSEKIQKVSP
uniref:dTDP-4-dehydrorhamnose 3,5-epimerase n=1 Tax=Plectus sambesii TaxID=2011161 RepID=A0A914VFK9_9BILA